MSSTSRVNALDTSFVRRSLDIWPAIVWPGRDLDRAEGGDYSREMQWWMKREYLSE